MIPKDKFDDAKHREAMSIYTKNLLGGTEQHSETANSGISVIPNLSDSLFYFDGTSVIGLSLIHI
jgi:hypothetical protein